MKKIMIIALCVALVCAFGTGCSEKKPEATTPAAEQTTAEATTAQESHAAFCWSAGRKIKFRWNTFLVN